MNPGGSSCRLELGPCCSLAIRGWIPGHERHSHSQHHHVVLRKLDSTGKEVFFSGFNGYERDGLAKGWLRASHRELDSSRSTPLRPWHSHTSIQKVRSGDVVSLEVEIWPSATLFEAGSTLQLTIQGHDAARYPAFGHRELVNRGWHTIFTGGPHDSSLAVPLNKSEATEVSSPQAVLLNAVRRTEYVFNHRLSARSRCGGSPH
jgi:hypothetical protein